MKNKIVIDFPKMSWEIPIEEEILNYCNHMARQFRKVEEHNRETGWFANNSFSEKCGATAMAYETVAKHINEEINFRKSIKTHENTK